MKREIVITPRARIEIENIFELLKLRWNEKTKNKFSNKINQIVNQIAGNPELFPISSINKKIRKAVISKQSILSFQ